MKGSAQVTETQVMEDGPLFKSFQAAQPMFSTNEDARAFYLERLERLAGSRHLTIEGMLEQIEASSTWSAEDREAMRISNLLSALAAK
jgi:hypothetical protein